MAPSEHTVKVQLGFDDLDTIVIARDDIEGRTFLIFDRADIEKIPTIAALLYIGRDVDLVWLRDVVARTGAAGQRAVMMSQVVEHFAEQSRPSNMRRAGLMP